MNFEQLSEASLPMVVGTPDNFDSSHQYGMIVLMHGFGSHMGDLAGLAPLINENDYIYVCPNAPKIVRKMSVCQPTIKTYLIACLSLVLISNSSAALENETRQ